MIPVSDLRKGNLVKTEFGILPVHHIVFSDIYVQGKDGRVLYARDVEGVELTTETFKKLEFEESGHEIHHKSMCLEKFKSGICYSAGEGIELSHPIQFAHELQNLFYWIERTELTIQL